MSVAANVAHSYVPPAGEPAGWRPHAGAVFGAVFWPVALLVAVEIMARVNWPGGRWWVAVRWAGLLPVAVVAALVSYRHMSGLLGFYREDPLTALVGPLAVDGLMVMAAGALLAIGRDERMFKSSAHALAEFGRSLDVPSPALAASNPPVQRASNSSPTPVGLNDHPADSSKVEPAPSNGSTKTQARRAHEAALALREPDGQWPTVEALAAAAGVSRGTAGTALKGLRR